MSASNVVIVNNTAGAYNPVPMNTTQVGQESRQTNLRYLKTHRIFGIFHIAAGAIIFLLEVAGLAAHNSSPNRYSSRGAFYGYVHTPAVGIWCGLFLVITGIIQLCAGVKDNRCCLIGALVMDIITAVIITGGPNNSILEILSRQGRNGSSANTFNIIKAGLNTLVVCVTFVTMIVHSGFSCAETCCRGNSQPRGNQQAYIVAAPQQPMAMAAPGQYYNMPPSGQQTGYEHGYPQGQHPPQQYGHAPPTASGQEMGAPPPYQPHLEGQGYNNLPPKC